MTDVLLYVASALTCAWGIAHLLATRGVVAGFGELTADNRRIITMEWIVEGVALVSIAALVTTVTLVDSTAAVSSAVYAVAIATLVVLALLDECESGDTGEPRVHEQDIAVEVRRHWYDVERGAWVVVDADGRLAGVGWVHRPMGDGTVTSDHYVRPDVRDVGLDEVFLDLMEERATGHARERQDGGVRLVTFCEPLLESRRELSIVRGFRVVREIHEVRLDLAKTPAAPRFPAGISVRTMRPGVDDRALHAASEDAFSEHFLYEPAPFEEWCVGAVRRDAMDPDLWLVAWDGDEVAGQVWVLPRGEEAYVEDLSVRKAWRGRGLGLALLLEAFRLLAGRGYPFVRLFVDAQNATGAVDLYLKAGMRVERRFEVFEKAIEA